eukprot:2916108-Rhodomonas_salina.4
MHFAGYPTVVFNGQNVYLRPPQFVDISSEGKALSAFRVSTFKFPFAIRRPGLRLQRMAIPELLLRALPPTTVQCHYLVCQPHLSSFGWAF